MMLNIDKQYLLWTLNRTLHSRPAGQEQLYPFHTDEIYRISPERVPALKTHSVESVSLAASLEALPTFTHKMNNILI